jgi:hypothetical protein
LAQVTSLIPRDAAVPVIGTDEDGTIMFEWRDPADLAVELIGLTNGSVEAFVEADGERSYDLLNVMTEHIRDAFVTMSARA